jgi:MFS transporter, ACDE family, multidrug resistance protein
MFSMLLVGRFIQGLGAGGTAPFAIALIRDVFQQSERTKQLGVLEAWNGISKIVAPVVGRQSHYCLGITGFLFYFYYH